MSGMSVLIGTSGWMYDHWRDFYYPKGVPKGRWYEHALTDYQTLELNVSFYRLPKREVFEGWAARATADAVITVKATRYLTHIKRLKDPKPSVDKLLDNATALGRHLGPILVQLPPKMDVDVAGLAQTLDAFPAGLRVAVEPRDDRWWTPDVRSVLTERNACLVWADRDDRRSLRCGGPRTGGTSAGTTARPTRGPITPARCWGNGPSGSSTCTTRTRTCSPTSTTIRWAARW